MSQLKQGPSSTLLTTSYSLTITEDRAGYITNTCHTFEVRVEPVMLIKFAPPSVARAFARRVFPMPGGPNSKIPLHGWQSSI